MSQALAVISTQIQISGLPSSGNVNIPGTPVINANASGQTVSQSFSANVFAAIPTIPSAAIGVWISVPTSNTGTITRKGVTGDTGNVLLTTGGMEWWEPLGTGAVMGLLATVSVSITFTFT